MLWKSEIEDFQNAKILRFFSVAKLQFCSSKSVVIFVTKVFKKMRRMFSVLSRK